MLITEYYRENKELPTVEELKTVFEIPPSSDPTFPRKKKVLTFYGDLFLPALMGTGFDKTVRPYKLAVDKTTVAGKEKVIITKQREAFGLVLYENCFTKWQATVPDLSVNPKAKFPKRVQDDADTHKFHDCKWTNSRSGQGSGWKDEGFKALNEAIKLVGKTRIDDSKRKWKVYTYMKDLIREVNGTVGNEPTTPASSSKKRKRQASAGDVDKYVSCINLEDEEEEEYSVGSEGSSGENQNGEE